MNVRVWLGVVCVLVACSSDEKPSGSRLTVTQVIGPKGGTVELTDGGKLEIPKGALATETRFTITEIADPKPLPSNLESAGKTYAFEPFDVVLAIPAKVSTPFEGDAAEVRPVKLDDDKDETWQTVVDSFRFNNVVSVTSLTLGIFQAVRPRRGTGVITLPDGAVVPEDAGNDAGTIEDAGNDATTLEDAGSDANTIGDAGSDANTIADAGSDANTIADAGSDANTIADAGNDADTIEDAGTPDDAGATVNAPPSANAGVDQRVDEGDVVQLDGAASDSDGNVTSVVWSQIGGAQVALSDANTLNATFMAPITTTPTVLVFEFSVQDDDGASDSDILLITVMPNNLAPTVSAAGSVTLPENIPGTLDGTATDPDGLVARTTWSQLLGPSATIADATALDTTFTPPNVSSTQVLVFQLEVEDDEGAVARALLSVTVVPVVSGNAAPIANAGADTTVASGSIAQLTASVSDLDGSVASTVWSQVSGTAVTLSNANIANPTFTAPAVSGCAQNLVFQVTVTDNLGAVSTDRVGVVISGGLGAPMALGTRSNFEGSTGGLTTPGTLWQRGAPTSGPGTANSGSTVWATNLAGNYTNNASDALCLPPISRAGAASVTLSFYVWLAGWAPNDGLTLEALNPELGWTAVSYVNPTFQSSTIPGWITLGRQSLYALVLAEVPTWAGDNAQLRFVFKSDGANVTTGAYLDDLGVHSEASDPDNDGLPGIEDEVAVYGTNPFVADSDGDGVNDGAEVQANTNPTDGSDFPGGPTLMPGEVLTFEGTDCGGLTALKATPGESTLVPDTLWRCGLVGSGPGRAHSGSRAWATNLTGNYADNDVSFLYLPPIDLSGVSDADLSFRLWATAYSSDGLNVQVETGPNVWIALSPTTPAYEGFDATGAPAWNSIGSQSQYALAIVPLTAYAGQSEVKLRLSFRSNGGAAHYGFYIDDIGVHDTTDDPDSDGIDGVRNEWSTSGTNPFEDDTDGDGSLDGEEVSLGTDPLNPADFDMAPVITPPALFDFEASDGGFAAMQTFPSGTEPAPDDRWGHGVVASGPNVAYSGTRVWATVLNGNYVDLDRSYLYLPAINLGGLSSADLSFRFWMRAYSSDGLSVEAQTSNGSWVGVSPLTPVYEGTDGDGKPAWNNAGRQNGYALAILPLDAFAGQSALMLRFAFRSNGGAANVGAYVDNLAVHRGTDDPDNDGIAGVANEWRTRRTDPFIADTDGDGVLDGAEVSAGSDPLNPADASSVTKMLPGELLDLELNNGGLVPLQPDNGDVNFKPDTLWQWGSPGSGPGFASSGTRVWATNLTGNYSDNDVSYLYLRPINLAGVVDADLSFRMWSAVFSADGLSVEVQTSGGAWARLAPLTPAYNGTDGTGAAAWSSFADLTYTLAIVPLTAYAGNNAVKVRFAFRSNGGAATVGFYLDDIAVHSSTQDPDNDTLIGVGHEWSTYGTDPLRFDTDTDGASDGVEETQGTHALDPADFPGVTTITAGTMQRLESANGGFATRGPLWTYGNVGNGPGTGASGVRAWCTNCTGNYFDNANEYLYAPPIQVPNVTNSTFAFHMWNTMYGSDGLSLEIWDNTLGWQTLAVDPVRPYNATDGIGRTAWGTYAGTKYNFTAARLNAWAGQTVLLRFAFRSNGGAAHVGSYLDDFAFANEAVNDPDADGLLGLLNEYNSYGTDPLVADTDGDGVNDGTEVGNATNPLNPLSF